MKIAIAQINPTVGALAANGRRIAAAAARARNAGCELVVFPEMATMGYPPRDLVERAEVVADNLELVERLVADIRGIGVVLGYVDRNRRGHGNPLSNAAVLFENGRVLHRAHKRLLPAQDVFDERRHFEPGRECTPVAFHGRLLGLLICEDAWNDDPRQANPLYATNPVERLVAAGADLLVNVSASPYHLGKRTLRRRVLTALCRRHRVPLVYANQVGGNDELLFDGSSCVIDDAGDRVVQAAEFEEDLAVWDMEARSGDVRPVTADPVRAMHRALVMGTRDYARKCGFQRAVLGLSGGIDSALTAAVAAEALGAANVLGVFMPSPYTSADNHTDTRELAVNLGIAYRTVAIDEMFRTFTTALSPEFDPARPGITEQNLQARIRGTILMAEANREHRLVLATGNKSELALGYCTLYGDMCGGLAVLADVSKTLVYRLARVVNAEGPVIPERTIAKAPSAELAPGQTDQDDLPPYAVVDPLIEGYVEHSRGVHELVAAGHPPEMVREVIARIDRNEHKRRQAAPGLKVTTRAFGVGRRYPIAQDYRHGENGHPPRR